MRTRFRDRHKTGWAAGCLILIGCLAVILSKCVHRHGQEPREKLTRVSVRLKWLPQSQFAGNYVAAAKGFYRQAGIECDLRPGGQDFGAVRLVAGGSEDFGIAGADEIVVARGKGIPVVALAVIYQESPVCFFAKKESGISSPQDFVGKRVAMQYGTNVRTEYVAMLSALGIQQDAITEVPSSFDMQSFFSGKVDVWNGYVINEVQTAKERGFEVNVVRPHDYGIRMYADCLFTTEENIRRRPAIVRAFVSATIRGWKHAIEHQDEAVNTVLQIDHKLNRQHEMQMLLASVPLISPIGSAKRSVGGMVQERWAEMVSTLAAQKLIHGRVRAEDCFTTVFLDEP